LSEALARVDGDARRVSLDPSMIFESSIEPRRQLTLGGATSPRLLRSEPTAKQPLPHHLRLNSARVICVEDFSGAIMDWVPLLEAVAKANESLLVLVDRVTPGPLLATLIINAEREILSLGLALVGGAGSSASLGAELARAAGLKAKHVAPRRGEAPTAKLERLPQADFAVLRRASAAVCFAPGGALDALGEPGVVIRVGGSCRDDQDAGVAYLAERLALA